jgi:hypothetical protein
MTVQSREQRIKVNKAKCLKCEDILISGYRHDFKFCSCGSIFVDGGKDYIRRGGHPEHIEELSEYEDA